MFFGTGMSSFKYLEIVIKNLQTVSEDDKRIFSRSIIIEILFRFNYLKLIATHRLA